MPDTLTHALEILRREREPLTSYEIAEYIHDSVYGSEPTHYTEHKTCLKNFRDRVFNAMNTLHQQGFVKVNGYIRHSKFGRSSKMWELVEFVELSIAGESFIGLAEWIDPKTGQPYPQYMPDSTPRKG